MINYALINCNLTNWFWTKKQKEEENYGYCRSSRVIDVVGGWRIKKLNFGINLSWIDAVWFVLYLIALKGESAK